MVKMKSVKQTQMRIFFTFIVAIIVGSAMPLMLLAMIPGLNTSLVVSLSSLVVVMVVVSLIAPMDV